jgi:glutamate decarboxylase
MSDGAGGGLPLVAYRLPPDENRLWDEYALAHVLRQRGWVIPAYTMAPHSNQLKMMRIVLREDFSMDRCNVLVEDMKMAMNTLEEMDRAMIEQYIRYVLLLTYCDSEADGYVRHSSRQSQSGKPDHPVYPGEKHSLQGKTGKTHAVC